MAVVTVHRYPNWISVPCVEGRNGTAIIIIIIITALGLSPGGSGYFTCKQNMKLVTTNLSREGYMRSM